MTILNVKKKIQKIIYLKLAFFAAYESGDLIVLRFTDEYEEFIADHPSLYYILNTETNATILTGRFQKWAEVYIQLLLSFPEFY